jgi:hypothetical protein
MVSPQVPQEEYPLTIASGGLDAPAVPVRRDRPGQRTPGQLRNLVRATLTGPASSSFPDSSTTPRSIPGQVRPHDMSPVRIVLVVLQAGKKARFAQSVALNQFEIGQNLLHTFLLG